MSLFSKIGSRVSSEVPEKLQKLPNRFLGNGGFMKMGATTHAKRTNSPKEIIGSLKILAQEEVEKNKNYSKSLLQQGNDLGIDIEQQAKSRGIEPYQVALEIFEEKGKPLRNLSRPFNNEERKLAGQLNSLKDTAVGIIRSKLKHAEINEFISQATDMPQRHLSLAHDVVDLSNTNALINHEIFPSENLNSIGIIKATNKESTYMGYLLNLLPSLSKENPKAVDLAETVVSHSDDTNSKFFLLRFLENAQKAPEQAELTEKLVPTLAKRVLKGMPSMDLGASSKENIFYQIINHLASPDSKPENLKLMDSMYEMLGKLSKKTDHSINIDDLRLGDTNVIQENIDALPYLLENAEIQGKNLDVSGFLTKNVNLT